MRSSFNLRQYYSWTQTPASSPTSGKSPERPETLIKQSSFDSTRHGKCSMLDVYEFESNSEDDRLTEHTADSTINFDDSSSTASTLENAYADFPVEYIAPFSPTEQFLSPSKYSCSSKGYKQVRSFSPPTIQNPGRRVYGFHQNPHQRWQHYCDTGAHELLSILQLQQQKNQHQSSCEDISQSQASPADTDSLIDRSEDKTHSSLKYDSDATDNLTITVHFQQQPQRSIDPSSTEATTEISEQHNNKTTNKRKSAESISREEVLADESSRSGRHQVYQQRSAGLATVYFCAEGITRIPFTANSLILKNTYPNISATTTASVKSHRAAPHQTATYRRNKTSYSSSNMSRKRSASAAISSTTPANSPTFLSSSKHNSSSFPSSFFLSGMRSINHAMTGFSSSSSTTTAPASSTTGSSATAKTSPPYMKRSFSESWKRLGGI